MTNRTSETRENSAGGNASPFYSDAIGLAMHAESWAEAAGCRIIRDVHQATWRKEFLGSMPRPPKGKNVSSQLKDLAVERCKQLGFTVERHDQAEAIGILTYAFMALDVRPPWLADEVLRPPLGVAVR